MRWESCMKSSCQISNGSLSSLKCPGEVWICFPGSYFGQVGQARLALSAVFLAFPHQYWFINPISLSVDQWFNICTVVRSGNFRILEMAILLFDPNQNSLFLSTSHQIPNIVSPCLGPVVGHVCSIFPNCQLVGHPFRTWQRSGSRCPFE